MAKHLNVNLQFTADTSQAKAQIQSLQQSLTQLSTANIGGKGMTGYTQDVTKAISKVNELKSVLASATNSSGTLDLGKFNDSMKKAGSSIEDYKKHLSQLGPTGKQAFAQLAQSVSTASVPIKQTSGLLNEMATTLKNTARWQLTSSLVHGFMSSLQGAMSYAQGLDKSLTNIRIVSGMSADEMESFAVQANKSAQALSTTTKAYADAALIYYQQGLAESEVKKRTDVTIKMANVTGEAAADVSSYMTAIWNNFNKEGQYAEEHFADIMTKLGAETAASTDEIAAGLSKFSAVADTVGLSFEMASSAVTAVVDQTREAPEVVGTAMKTIFSRVEGLKMGETLEDGVDLNKYSEGLAKVGVDIFDANGNLKDMDNILHEIGDTWGTLSREEQIALSQTVAGIRQYNQFMAIFDNWGNVEENLERAAEAGGTLQEQADIYAESWEGARNRVKAALEEIWGKVIDDDFFIDLNNFLADFLGVISEVIDSLGGMKGVLLMLSTLMMNVFGKSMAAGIDRFAYNIHLTSKKGQQEIETLRTNTAKAMSSMAKEMGNSISGQAMSKTFAGTASIQEKIIEQTKRIAATGREVSTEEQNFFNAVLETNQALSDQYMAIQKNREALADQVKVEQSTDKRSMIAAASGDPDRKENLQKRQKLYDLTSNRMQKNINTSTLGMGLHDQLKQQMQQGASSTAMQGFVKSYIQQIKEQAIPVTEQFKKTLEKLSVGEINDIELEELRAQMGLCEERAGELQGKLQQIYEKSGSTNIPQKKAEDAAKSMTNLANKTKDAVNAGVGLDEKTKQTKADLDSMDQGFTLGQKITAVAGAMSAMAMTISSINGMINTLQDPDATGWEKFSAVLMTVGMTLPLLSSAFSMTNIQMLAGASASVAQAMGWSVAGKAAAVAAGEVTAFGTALWTALWPIGLVMLAIAGLVGIFVALYRQAHKAEREFKKASETADTMNQRYEDSKTALEEVNGELDTLAEKRKTLGELTKGTEEWNKALEDSNNYVLDLIDKYPELAQYVYTDENGALAISEVGQNKLIERKEQEVEDAKIAKTSANIDKNEAEIVYNEDSIQKNIRGASGARGQTQEISDSAYEKVLDLAKEYGTDIPEDKLMEAVGNNRSLYDSVIKNLPEIVTMLGKNNALQEANNVQSRELGKSIVEKAQDKYGMPEITDENRDDYKGLEGSLADEYDRVYEEEKAGMKWDSKQSIINDYLAINGDLTLTDKNGGKGKAAVFKDANGNEVKMTVDEMIDAIAANNAMDKVADKWDTVADRLLEVNKNSPLAKAMAGEEEGGLSGNLGQSLFSVNQNGEFDYSSLSSGDIQRLAEKEDVTAEDLGIDDKTAKEYGFTTGQEMADAFMKGIRDKADLENTQDDKAAGGAMNALSQDDDNDRISEKELRDNNKAFSNYKNRGDGLTWDQDDAFASRSKAGYYDKNERNDIIAEAGVDETYFNEQKSDISKNMSSREATWNEKTSQVEMGESKSYDELKDSYEKYQKAVKDGNDELAEQYKDEAKQFRKTENQLNDLAAAQTEMNDGAGELVDNWDAWSSALDESNQGTEEYAAAMDNVKDSTAKMLNVSSDALSDNFIADNLEDIEAAANGDAEAMNRLRSEFAEDYAANIEITGDNPEDVRERFTTALGGLSEEIGDLEIGASLDDSEYINTLNSMLANGELTEEQVNEALSGMGYEPQIESVPATLFTGGWPKSPISVDIFGVDLGTIPAGLIPEINLPIKVPQITGGNKKTNKTTPITSGGGGGGGGGSPRGGSRPRGRTRERQRGEYKKLKNEKERYHEINNQLEDMEHKLNMIEKAKDRAFGKNKLKLMNQEQAALKKQIELQKKYQAEIKTNLNNDRKKVADLGAKFDKNGTITNYDEMIADATKDYNAKMKDFENLSASKQDELDKKYKRLTNPETGNKYSGYKDYLEAEYNKVKDAIDQYEETQDLAKDVEEQIQDSLNELYDLELEEVDYKVQLKLEVNEDDKKIIDFLMDRMDGDAWRTGEQIALHDRNIVNSQENIDTAKSGLEGIFANHEGIDSAGVMEALNSGDYAGAMSLLGDEAFTEAEVEKIKEYSDTILDETANIKDEQMAVVDSMNDVFDAHMEHFEQFGDSISHASDMLSAYGEVIDLVGQEELGISAETMQKMRDTSIELLESANANAKNKFDQAKAEYDYAEDQLKAARETGDKELIKHWEDVVQHTKEGMQDAESEWMSSWTELLQAARDKFDDEMQESIRNFEKAVAGAAGSLEGLSDQMDLHAMVDDNYLEDYERIYELNKLNREIENSIDNTSNVRAKEALLELEDKITQAKESGRDMSEHEVEALRKQYELKLAEIALEEAQNSKSQVRMTKDAEGNFSYVYTADDSAVEDAEQNYEDKLKEYQELNHNYIKDLESQLVETQQNYAQAMAAAAEMYGYGTDEYTQAVALIQQKYTEEMGFLHSELQMTMDDNQRLHTEDVASYAQNVGDTQMLNMEYIGSFDQTTYSLATGYASRTAAEQAWQTASAAVMSAAEASMQAYQNTVNTAMEANTGATSSFGEAVSSSITSIADVSSTLASNVSSTLQDVTSHWGETSSAVSSFAEMYNNTLSTLVESNEKFVETVGKVTSAWAEVQEESTSTTTRASTPTTRGSSGGNNNNNNTRPTGSRLVGRKVKLKSNARLATSSDRSARLNTPYRGRNVYVQRYIRGRTSPYHVGISTNFNNSGSWVGWLDIKQIEGYRTGGYTGKWNNTDGRLAMLHQKEIVLNAHDTENFLKTVDIVRQIAQTIDLNALASSGGIGQGLHSTGVNSHSQDLQQQVHITAEFPNATDKNEIIKAFDNVINLAAQYANKKR